MLSELVYTHGKKPSVGKEEYKFDGVTDVENDGIDGLSVDRNECKEGRETELVEVLEREERDNTLKLSLPFA